MLNIKHLFSQFSNSLKSDFTRNVSKLMTGSILSQILPLSVAPILSRIYLPSDYGLLGLYMSVTGMISMVTTLQYANAIVIAKDEQEVNSILKLCFQILLLFSLVSLIIVIVFHASIASYIKAPALSYWLWMAPLSIFMTGLSGIFNNYAIRYKHYSILATNRVLTSIFSSLCSLLLGYLTHNVMGLFFGLLVGQIISGVFLAYSSIKKAEISLSHLFLSNSKSVALKYINFPKYSLPADFINNFTNQIPLLMLNTYGSIAAVGYFNMGNRILGLPIGFISSAFGEVFRQKAAQDYNEQGNCISVFIKTFKILSLFSIVPFTILILFGPEIFAFILGEKWREAGVYAQIMGIMFFFRFTVSPLTYLYIIANKQKENFYLHFLFFIISYLAFFLGYQVFHSTKTSILIYSILYSAIYCLYLIRSFHFSRGNNYEC